MRFLLLNRWIKESARYRLLVFLLLLGVLSASSQNLYRYSIRIELPRDRSLSGICIIRMEEKERALSIINEFGIKAFDAVYSDKKGKVKLYNVVTPLNKRFVRRLLAKDMSLLLCPEKKHPKNRNLSHEENGSIILTNKRFKITYFLNPLEDVVE